MLSNCLNTWESIRQVSFAKKDTSPTSSSLIRRCDQYITNVLPPLSLLRYRSSLPTVKSKSGDLKPANSLCQCLHGVHSVENNMNIIHDIMKTSMRKRVPFDANSSAFGKKMPVGHFQDSSTTSPFCSCGQLALRG